MQDFITNSIQFSNNSSIGHVLEWVAGIEAMITSPLGMGLGASGRVTALEEDAVGVKTSLSLWACKLVLQAYYYT